MSVLGDLNGLIGDKKKIDITGSFGVEVENEDFRKLVDFVQRCMC